MVKDKGKESDGNFLLAQKEKERRPPIVQKLGSPKVHGLSPYLKDPD